MSGWNLLDDDGDLILRVDDAAYPGNTVLELHPATDDESAATLDLPRLRALIAELTRRERVLAAQAGQVRARCSDRMQLRDVPAGSIFETETGIRAVKTEYYYQTGGIECVLLASGEYAHFGGDGGVAAHNSTWVRLLSVGGEVPVRTAEDERADVVAMRLGRSPKEMP